MSSFTVQNIFSVAARDRFLTNFKKLKIPTLPSHKMNKPVAQAAVLVPLCSHNDNVSILFTVRSSKLRTHSGQISFPGGKTDEGESPDQTAIRETHEEIGIPADKIDVWGYGPSFPGRNSEIRITPVICSIEDLRNEDLKISEDEVSEVFLISLEQLCDPKNHHHTQYKNGFILPVFTVERYRIWGITAFMTHHILNCLLPRKVYKNEWMNNKVVL